MAGQAHALGWPAADFALPGIDGKTWRLADVRGSKGTVVMFICNHCPYVIALIDEIVRDVQKLDAQGVRSIAIMPNDTEAYPQDSLDNMTLFARQHRLTFPYVIDRTQEISRLYRPVCTPEFFGFNAALELQYHGRLLEGGKNVQPGAKRELYEAMVELATTGRGPSCQVASMGCSIKWRDA